MKICNRILLALLLTILVPFVTASNKNLPFRRGRGATKDLPHVAAAALVPARGGAVSKKTTNDNAADTLGVLKDFFQGKKKLPWVICTLLSVYYFLLYTKRVPSNLMLTALAPDTFYKEGFCVTGLNSETRECSKVAGNSHQFAWGIDVLYTIGALILPFTPWPVSKKQESGESRQPAEKDKKDFRWFVFNAVVIAFVIVAHGFLHRVFSVHSCDLSSAGDGGNEHFFAAVHSKIGGPQAAYVAFVFILMLVDLLGFSSIPQQYGFGAVLLIAAVVTAVVFFTTNTADPSVASFFMISQLAVSLTGWLVPNEETVTPQLGWAFIAPCVVSLLEYLKCSNFLVQYGGHSWYDFWLHLSMIVALLFGTYKYPSKLGEILHGS